MRFNYRIDAGSVAGQTIGCGLDIDDSTIPNFAVWRSRPDYESRETGIADEEPRSKLRGI